MYSPSFICFDFKTVIITLSRVSVRGKNERISFEANGIKFIANDTAETFIILSLVTAVADFLNTHLCNLAEKSMQSYSKTANLQRKNQNNLLSTKYKH